MLGTVGKSGVNQFLARVLCVFAFLVLLAAQALFAQTREVTLLLRDSYGDGWHSAALGVVINGVTMTPNPTISSSSGSSSTYKFTAESGDEIEVYSLIGTYSGRYDDECAFAFYYTDSPPSPAFNPVAGASNDAENILFYVQYGGMGGLANWTRLGAFTVTLTTPSITVSPKKAPLLHGETRTFTATLRNMNPADKTVSWSVSGNTSSATTISASALLTVAMDEKSAALTVTARSNADPDIVGAATVNLPILYPIGTAAELLAFADSINSGKNFGGRLVVLTADIDLSVYGATHNGGKGWAPIGSPLYPFNGTFDGRGHVIRNMYISTTVSYSGLFGQVGSTSSFGTVKNVGLENVNISGGNYTGGVVGMIRGYGDNVGGANQVDYVSTVTDCYVTGSVKGSSYAGGIAGSVSSWGHTGYCYSAAEVSGSTSGTTYTGGIAGYLDGEVSNCVALNKSVTGGTASVGRVVGSVTQYGLLNNNSAYDEMLNRSNTTAWTNKGASGVSGADISASTVYIDSTLEGRFAHSPWVTKKGFLPAFGSPLAIPAYIINEPATVTAVTVSPPSAQALRGKAQNIQFSATVTGTGKPAQAVAWSVSGGVAGTAISAGGLLTISAGETAASLTVMAVSAQDETKSATASVAIVDVDLSTPVAYHGRLSVRGNRVYNQYGDTVQLRGMSMFWSMASEGRDFYNSNAVHWLADDWKVNVVRAAMGVDETWINSVTKDTASGYLAYDNSGGVSNKKRVTDVVDAAIARGIYVIIDWHSHEAHLHRNEAKDFFKEMAAKYKDVPNVIYEIYNEPLDISWSTVKTYSQVIVDTIRSIDPNGLIILGTPNWSQDVDVATADPVIGDNLLYCLHFYAASASHKAALRTKVTTALNRNRAVFISEFGTCYADGNSPIDTAETTTWLNFLNNNRVSYVNWSISDKLEAASALKPGASTAGGWAESDLTLSGKYIRGRFIKAAENETFTTSKTLTYRAGANGKLLVYDSNKIAAMADSSVTRVMPGADGPAVSAVPSDGYAFVKWSDGSTDAERKDNGITDDIDVTAIFDVTSSIMSPDRVVPPGSGNDNDMSIVAPVNKAKNMLTAGPNPVAKSSGEINFFRCGELIEGGTLTVYDASGNAVRKISIADNANCRDAMHCVSTPECCESPRIVGSWDLKDAKGRAVPEGTYLVKGAVTASGGKKERVSLMVGVR